MRRSRGPAVVGGLVLAPCAGWPRSRTAVIPSPFDSGLRPSLRVNSAIAGCSVEGSPALTGPQGRDDGVRGFAVACNFSTGPLPTGYGPDCLWQSGRSLGTPLRDGSG